MPGVLMFGLRHNLMRGCELKEHALAHHAHGVTHFNQSLQVMGYEYDGKPKLLPQPTYTFQNGTFHDDIECRGRLVHNDQPWL